MKILEFTISFLVCSFCVSVMIHALMTSWFKGIMQLRTVDATHGLMMIREQHRQHDHMEEKEEGRIN